MRMFVLKLIFAFFVVMIMVPVTWIWIFNALPFFKNATDGYESHRAYGLGIGLIAIWIGLVIWVW
jgi:hypothetical protein